MPDNKQSFLAAAKAEDTRDLLDHIAWTEVIHPALQKERDAYTQLLVSATLGMPVQVKTADGVSTVTREQLAGRIDGINFITGLFELILKRGVAAIRDLSTKGINLSSPVN